MAKITKEQKLYLAGMQAALEIVKKCSVEELEKEVNYRCNYPVPVGINRRELTDLARMKSRAELMYLATAMADTMTNYLHMPPMVIHSYLKQFNKRIIEFREDPELYEKVQLDLDSDTAMIDMLKEFVEEDDINEND